MTDPRIHEYTVPMWPTREQVADLERIGHAARRIERAWVRVLRAHPELAPRSPNDPLSASDEAAIATLAAEDAVPVEVLRWAVQNCQQRSARGLPVTERHDPAPVAGDGLITPAVDAVVIAGVRGAVRMGVGHLPRWAAAVWRRAAGDLGVEPDLDLAGAAVTGWGYAEPGEYAGQPGWLLDVAVRWDAYPEWLLMRPWDDAGDPGPARRQVAHLMGRAP